MEGARKVLLIDDDPDYAALVAAYAQNEGLELTWSESLKSLGRVGSIGSFDVAVLDFQLQDMTGLEIAAYVDVFFKNIPVVLVSADSGHFRSPQRWPRCVKGVVDKRHGVMEVMRTLRRIRDGEQPAMLR